MKIVDYLEKLAREHGWVITAMDGSASRAFARDGLCIYVLCDDRGRVYVVRIGDDPPRRDREMVDDAAAVLAAPRQGS